MSALGRHICSVEANLVQFFEHLSVRQFDWQVAQLTDWLTPHAGAECEVTLMNFPTSCAIRYARHVISDRWFPAVLGRFTLLYCDRLDDNLDWLLGDKQELHALFISKIKGDKMGTSVDGVKGKTFARWKAMGTKIAGMCICVYFSL